MSDNRKLDDYQVLEQIRSQSNPTDAVRQLYRDCFRSCAAYVKEHDGNDQDAEDIFQEVVVSFIEIVRAGRFRGESSINTFLYAITRNTWLNEQKKRNRSRARDEKFEKEKDQSHANITDYIAGRETRQTLIGLIDALGENCKAILLAFYFENLPMKDILTRLSYENEQVVRNKKYKCLKKLSENIAGNKTISDSLQSALFYE
jgi:RNA polymerase sigma factor (sigma-70 family)